MRSGSIGAPSATPTRFEAPVSIQCTWVSLAIADAKFGRTSGTKVPVSPETLSDPDTAVPSGPSSMTHGIPLPDCCTASVKVMLSGGEDSGSDAQPKVALATAGGGFTQVTSRD